MDDIEAYNRQAWDSQVERKNRWTLPVDETTISAAKEGRWEVVLTPQRPVPSDWFPMPFAGCELLGLASGGGQQAPIFAAAGAHVTVLDNSRKQLQQDQAVAQREGLSIRSVLGSMRDLSCFADEQFDVVFNPCSVSFIPEVQSVFQEAYRVLRPGGRLLCGFINPARFIFDEAELEAGRVIVRHPLPYADSTRLGLAEQDKLRAEDEPFMFSHSWEDLISGQLRAGFTLRDLIEDSSPEDVLANFLPTFFATLATK